MSNVNFGTTKYIVLMVLCFNGVVGFAANYQYTVDCSEPYGHMDMFWNASGLAMDYSTAVQRQNMLLIGSIPHQGCLYQRPHSLLDLIDVSAMDTTSPQYDFSRFDTFVDLIVKSGQRPFFEIMGNPSKHFSDFSDPNQVRQWKRLIKDVAIHLKKRYGQAEVRKWYFETWNEPDGDYRWQWDLEEFYNYYDASSAGLYEADPALRFGGPGTARSDSEYISGLLDHCVNGTNFFTQQKGTRIDFVSYHYKGKQPRQVDKGIAVVDRMLKTYPYFQDKLVINNEADVKCCWKDEDKPYRAHHWYAAYIARQTAEHYYRLIHDKGIAFRLANDNAFVGDWIHRTHFKWFGSEDKFVLIKQAVHNQMIAQSLLGDVVLKITPAKTQRNFQTPVAIFPTRRGDRQVAVMIYAYDSDHEKSGLYTVNITLENLPFDRGKIALYRIDRDYANAHNTWCSMGSPKELTPEQILLLRDTHELILAKPLENLKSNTYTTSLSIPLHTTAFLILSADPGCGPAVPKNVYVEKFTGLIPEHEDVLILFDSGSRFIQTYEILACDTPIGPFTRINESDIIAAAYIDSKPLGQKRYYKVRAVDYFDRVSPASSLISVK